MPRKFERADTRFLQLRATARRQRGLFTLAQVLAAGFDRDRVRFELAVGAWQEVAPRVYRAGPAATLTKTDELGGARALVRWRRGPSECLGALQPLAPSA